MKILSADIGGTTSRFAHFECLKDGLPEMREIMIFDTKHNDIGSFADLINNFKKNKSSNFSDLSDYDIAVFAVAGPVRNNSSNPVNIKWKIAGNEIKETNCIIINDFVAQSYACLLPKIANELMIIKKGKPDSEGIIAIIGAGTGLGHSALLPQRCLNYKLIRYLPIPSEGGHLGFNFVGDEELKFSEFAKKKLNKAYLYGDVVVSGIGLSLLHQFFTGRKLEPKEVVESIEDNQKTLELFSRFYGRACRNYALVVYATGGVIISGGIAAKNPGIVKRNIFKNEFLDSPMSGRILQLVPIYLNCKEDIGLYGAAYYAQRLFIK